jgi:hypothetical protein
VPLPNLVIVGSQKCGTTSLHTYLGQHPSISMSATKEINFFNWQWDRGLDWYASQFDGAAVRGEASTDYTRYPTWPEVADRMAATIPDARVLYIVRDPVDRMVAAWRHVYAKGVEVRTFDEAVHDGDFDRSDYLARSRYHTQLGRYLDRFPEEHVLVLTLEGLAADQPGTLARVFEFLGVDPEPAATIVSARANASEDLRRRPLAARVLLGPPRRRDRRIGPARARMLDWLTDRWGRPVAKPAVSSAAVERIRGALEGEMAQLRARTGLETPGWRF